MKKGLFFVLIGLFIFTACLREGAAAPTPATETVVPLPTATPTKMLPTPSSTGDSIVWDTLRLTFLQSEITQEYLNDFGSTRLPSDGQKFLWVHIRLKNTGQIQKDLPIPDHYSILYAAVELKPIYGHRLNYTDYTTLGPVIFPEQELDGWLRFDIPATAEINELRFVFLPESAQVGASYSSPYYPYADDKPTFVWNCAP